MNDLVSIIIPCFNASLYVKDAVQSVIGQTHSNWELILVDDHSTDSTFSELEKLQLLHPSRIKVMLNPAKGAAAARNAGLAISTGNYIQFLDADDLIISNKIEIQLQGFSPDVDVVYSDLRIDSFHENKILEHQNFKSFGDDLFYSVFRQILTSGNPLYRAEAVKKIGGYNPDLSAAQDWDFHIRLFLSGSTFSYIPGEFFIIRKMSDSISSNWVKVYETACDHLPQLKSGIRNHSLYSIKVGDYLASVYYLTLVHSKKVSNRSFYRTEMRFWAENRVSFIQSGMKRVIAKVIGLRFLELLDRIRSRN